MSNVATRESSGEPPVFDVHFEIAGRTHLRFSRRVDELRLSNYLGQYVRKRPNDLRAHVQRIFLLTDQAHEAKLFGALVDLFIALGEAGQALKRRCLTRAAPVLQRQHLDFLEQAIDSGLRADAPFLSQAKESVLGLGIQGRSTIVHKTGTRQNAAMTPYDEAMSCMEYGQLDEARRILEHALRQSNDDPRVASELLAIYRHLGDEGAFQSMRTWLHGTYGALPDGW